MMKLDLQMFAESYTHLGEWGTYYLYSGTNEPKLNGLRDFKANYILSYYQDGEKTRIRIQPYLRIYNDGNSVSAGSIRVYARVTNSTTGTTYKSTNISLGTLPNGYSIRYGEYLYFDVLPNSDGTSTCQFAGYFGDGSQTTSCNYNYKLPVLNVKTVITSNTSETNRIEFGQPITFTTTSQNADVTNQLSYVVGETEYSIGTITGNNSLAYTFSKDLIKKFTDTAEVNIVVNNVASNGTTSTSNVYLKVPDSYVPTISSIRLEDVGQSVFENVWIQNKSKLKATIEASGVESSTIKTYTSSISGFDQTYTTNPFTTQPLTTTGDRTLTAKVKDSRGREATKTQAIKVLPYNTPSISEFAVERCLQDGTLDNEGTYALITCKYNISSIDNANAKKLIVQKDNGTPVEVVLPNYSGTYQGVLFSAILPNEEYDFECYLQDSFGNSQPLSLTLPTSETLVSKRRGGKGLTLGRIATEDGFHDYLGANFHNGLKKNGVDVCTKQELADVASSGSYNDLKDRPTIVIPNDYIVETGSNENGYYEKYNSGILKQYATLNFPSLSMTLQSGSMYLSSVAQKIYFPIAFTEVIAVSFGAIARVQGCYIGDLYNDYMNIYPYRFTQDTGVSGRVQYTAIGRWK